MRGAVPAFLLLLACPIFEQQRMRLTSVSFSMQRQIDKSEKN
jgi:hypothetical protein